MKVVFWLFFIMSYPFSATTLEFLSLINDGGIGGTDGLKGVLSVAASHDGKNVYMISTADSAIVTLDRNPENGALIYGRCMRNGQGRIDGMRGGVSVAVSPDDKNVYVASALDSALVIFGRNAFTGRLVYLMHLTDDILGVKALGHIRSVAVSPDNKNVYTVGTDSVLAVFNRDTESGKLSFRQLLRNRRDGVLGLSGAMSVVVSPDNKNVYVAGSGEGAVAVFNRELSSGALTYSACLKDNVDGVQGLMTVISLAVSPDGKNLYSVGVYDNVLAVFNRDGTNGALTYSTCFTFQMDSIKALELPYCVTVSPDNKNVFVSSLNDSSLAVFSRNPTTGGLSYNRNKKNGFHRLHGAYTVTISPDAENIYVTTKGDSVCPVATLKRDPVDGVFSRLDPKSSEIEGFSSPMSVAVSPDRRNVYAAGAVGNGLVIFDRDTVTGLLAFRSCLMDGRDGVDGMENPYAMAVSADNKNVYVVSLEDSALSVFNRDPATGALTYIMSFMHGRDGINGLDVPRSVAVSSDNRSVYVACYGDNSIMVFDRNITTGSLTYMSSLQNSVDGVQKMRHPVCVAVSPDNNNVYVAAHGDHSLIVFNRNETDGLLKFDTCYYTPSQEKQSFIFPISVTVSPDNSTVYLACETGNVLTVFNRDTQTGRLSINVQFNTGLDGLDSMGVAECVAVSPDNKAVYVNGGELALFNRDPVTGATTFDRCTRKGQDGFGKYQGRYCLAVSPDNRNVYMAAGNDGLAVFSLQPAFSTPVKKRDDRPAQRTNETYFDILKHGSELMINMAAPGNVEFMLYDAQGRLVRQLQIGYLNAGRHQVKSAFSSVPKGLYLLRLSGCTESRAVRVIVCN